MKKRKNLKLKKVTESTFSDVGKAMFVVSFNAFLTMIGYLIRFQVIDKTSFSYFVGTFLVLLTTAINILILIFCVIAYCVIRETYWEEVK